MSVAPLPIDPFFRVPACAIDRTAILSSVASSSMRWPFPRADMTEPGLVVWRLAEDMADLFDDGADPGVEALVALGWPRPLVAQYFEAARQHGSAIVAGKLDERRRLAERRRYDAPILLEPAEQRNEQERAEGEPGGSRSGSGGAAPSELRAFLYGICGGGLIGAILALCVVWLAEGLR